jgi:flagellar basal-body rod modification protein FlgD
MSVSGVTASQITNIAGTTASTTASSAINVTNAFDTDTFMQLLLAELKNQDPLEPMNNSEMVSQMAQLNSLQQLTSISSNIETMKDYMEALLGISS